MFISRLLGVLAGVVLVGTVAAQDVLLRSDAPQEYVVKKGDTLWDISAMFLEQPWLWPEIWYVNPQVENPHLIYPGDKLYLVWVDGRPMLRRGDGKLSPQVRSEPIDQAIPAIPLEYILPFLDRSKAVLTREEIDSAPYIVHFREDRVIGDEGTLAYVRKFDEGAPLEHLIFRDGEELRDLETGEVLGYHINHVGGAATGDPHRRPPARGDRRQPAAQLLPARPGARGQWPHHLRAGDGQEGRAVPHPDHRSRRA
ncbi:MAG: LysM peptidoglycan-binding domain-containing protein [Gammaproteobacteria bacterium]|nr:LysM peptidoglycan-binding domain-containing protein [Gammaproteobacteria bacterium]